MDGLESKVNKMDGLFILVRLGILIYFSLMS